MIKWLLLAIIIVTTVLGDLVQSHEMKRSGAQRVDARGLGQIARMIFSRANLLIGLICMAISFFAFMALVQNAPLSFAVPASAGAFVLETILAKFVLKEVIGMRRALGAALVLGGVVLLAR